MKINYQNSVAVQVYNKNVDSETSIGKKIGFGVAASLTALVETVARALFGIISLPAFAASGAAYLLGKDSDKVGINFFANNFKAIGEIFTSLFKESKAKGAEEMQVSGANVSGPVDTSEIGISPTKKSEAVAVPV